MQYEDKHSVFCQLDCNVLNLQQKKDICCVWELRASYLWRAIAMLRDLRRSKRSSSSESEELEVELWNAARFLFVPTTITQHNGILKNKHKDKDKTNESMV